MMAFQLELVAHALLVLGTFFVGASAISTCSTVEVTGAEGDLSGTYTYDGSGSYIRRGGSTSYILGKYTDDQWRLGQGFYVFNALDSYPHYYAYDTVAHPVDINEAWQLVASKDNEDEAPASFSIACADTSSSVPISSVCTAVEVTGAEGDLSGTYTYDDSGSYIRRGGYTSYILGKYTNDQWRLGQGFYIFNALDSYPHYYTYDTAVHPVDINEAWQLVASKENQDEAPTSFSITCADTSSSSPISSTCPTVEVTGAEGDLSGTYTYDESGSFIRRGGYTSYILGKYTGDQWSLGQGFYIFNALDNYPNYYTYDAALHPVDIEEAWQLVASSGNQDEAPSSFSITCAETSSSTSGLGTDSSNAGIWICASVYVAGAEGDMSGNYTYSSSGDYIRSVGDSSYVLGKDYDDQWLLGEGPYLNFVDQYYPYYYTYDDADSPVDIDQEWQFVAGDGIQGSAPSSFSVTCEGGYYNAATGSTGPPSVRVLIGVIVAVVTGVDLISELSGCP